MKLNFTKKKVVISGVNQGIGHEIARQFHSLGAEVYGIDLMVEEEDQCFTQCFNLDIADHRQVNRFQLELLKYTEHIDILINCAGILRLGSSEDIEISAWNKCINVNLNGTFYLTKSLIPFLKKGNSSSIVNIGSNAGHVPREGMIAYGASKAALKNLTQTLGLELSKHNIRCNMVSPGSTRTPMQQGMWADENSEFNVIRGDMESFKLGIPLNKIAEPKDIAYTVLFLASEFAGHTTMQDIVVDGGATLGS